MYTKRGRGSDRAHYSIKPCPLYSRWQVTSAVLSELAFCKDASSKKEECYLLSMLSSSRWHWDWAGGSESAYRIGNGGFSRPKHLWNKIIFVVTLWPDTFTSLTISIILVYQQLVVSSTFFLHIHTTRIITHTYPEYIPLNLLINSQSVVI